MRAESLTERGISAWSIPKYFDYADRRIKHLVDAGIVPAIVGAWGRGDCNSMQAFGVVGLKRHWRYLVARYGAYPVVWILAGEIRGRNQMGAGTVGRSGKISAQHRSLPPSAHLSHGPGAARRRGRCRADRLRHGRRESRRTKAAVDARPLAILTSACAKNPPMPVLVRRDLLRGAHAAGVPGCAAAHVLDVHAQRRGGPHLRRGGNLACRRGRRSGNCGRLEAARSTTGRPGRKG